MINKEIMRVFNDLNIPCFYSVAPKNNYDKYCIFSIYKEQELGIYEGSAIKVVYYCSINYWYKKPEDGIKYTEIKRALKANKMIVRDVVDLPMSNGYYGKNFNIKIVRLLNQDE